MLLLRKNNGKNYLIFKKHDLTFKEICIVCKINNIDKDLSIYNYKV